VFVYFQNAPDVQRKLQQLGVATEAHHGDFGDRHGVLLAVLEPLHRLLLLVSLYEG
jgi:hypothetical protein